MSSSGDIEIGNIYKIAANEENGITPPDGRDVWFKHFVVMGKAPDGSVYGCVVFILLLTMIVFWNVLN